MDQGRRRRPPSIRSSARRRAGRTRRRSSPAVTISAPLMRRWRPSCAPRTRNAIRNSPISPPPAARPSPALANVSSLMRLPRLACRHGHRDVADPQHAPRAVGEADFLARVGVVAERELDLGQRHHAGGVPLRARGAVPERPGRHGDGGEGREQHRRPEQLPPHADRMEDGLAAPERAAADAAHHALPAAAWHAARRPGAGRGPGEGGRAGESRPELRLSQTAVAPEAMTMTGISTTPAPAAPTRTERAVLLERLRACGARHRLVRGHGSLPRTRSGAGHRDGRRRVARSGRLGRPLLAGARAPAGFPPRRLEPPSAATGSRTARTAISTWTRGRACYAYLRDEEDRLLHDDDRR